MSDFKTKKAREDWLRSDDAWIEVLFMPPIRMSELWLKKKHFIKIQRAYRRSHYDIDLKTFVYDKAIIYPDTATQIFEVDQDEVIRQAVSIKRLVEIMIEEGL